MSHNNAWCLSQPDYTFDLSPTEKCVPSKFTLIFIRQCERTLPSEPH